MSADDIVSGTDLIEELNPLRSACVSLDAEHYGQIEKWNVAAYLDWSLDRYEISTEADLVGLIEGGALDACRIVALDRSLSVQLVLPIVRVFVEVLGVTDHLQRLAELDQTGVPSRDEFIEVVARVLIGLAEVRGLLKIR